MLCTQHPCRHCCSPLPTTVACWAPLSPCAYCAPSQRSEPCAQCHGTSAAEHRRTRRKTHTLTCVCNGSVRTPQEQKPDACKCKTVNSTHNFPRTARIPHRGMCAKRPNVIHALPASLRCVPETTRRSTNPSNTHHALRARRQKMWKQHCENNTQTEHRQETRKRGEISEKTSAGKRSVPSTGGP